MPALNSFNFGRTCSSKNDGLKLLKAIAAWRFRQKGTTYVADSLAVMCIAPDQVLMKRGLVNGVPPGSRGGRAIRKEAQKEIHIWLEVGVGSCWSSGNRGRQSRSAAWCGGPPRCGRRWLMEGAVTFAGSNPSREPMVLRPAAPVKLPGPLLQSLDSPGGLNLRS